MVAIFFKMPFSESADFKEWMDDRTGCHKVYGFWEGHKKWQNVVTIQLTDKVSSIFVAFLENMNFTRALRLEEPSG